MGSNRGLKSNRLNRKKKKKSKKSKKTSKLKVKDGNHMAGLMLNKPTTSGKIQDLIRDTISNISGDKIVQLLFHVKEKPEHCYDFELSSWLQKFLELGSVNLVEAAYLLVNAGRIYERKVDLLYELVRRSVERGENNSESSEKKQQTQPKTRRKITRQAVSVHDRLYEADMSIKQFKQMSPEKITEISTSSLKTPSHYFKKWSDYKLWRLNHKKKMKSSVPYSTVCDDLHLHPAMWGLSCIEDFDYDDDLDTKRNYRMLTHNMEHRFNTLVPDINFIMHFKVKDFIEAEQDEIEVMKILDLPAPPTRQWPPFCRTSYSKEYAKEMFNVDIGESAEDYIKKYVDLEDIVLEKQTYEIDGNLLRTAAEVQKGSRHHSSNSKVVTHDDVFSNLKNSTEAIASTEGNKELQDKNGNDDDSNANGSQGHDIIDTSDSQNVSTNTSDHSEELVTEQNKHNESIVSDLVEASTEKSSEENCSSLALTNDANSNEFNGVTESSVIDHAKDTNSVTHCNDVIESSTVDLATDQNSASSSHHEQNSLDIRPNNEENQVQLNDCESAVHTELIEEPLASIDCASPADNFQMPINEDGPSLNTDISPVNTSLLHVNKDASTIISESIQNNISDQIVIRISIDEGIAFSELDDIDKAMLSPVVELVDIFHPIKEEVLSSDDFNCALQNMFEIDERYLSFRENFSLPLDILYKEPEIKYNIFKIPESRLKRKMNFALPADFRVYMENRFKRKYGDSSDHYSPRSVKIFKLNEQNIDNVTSTPPGTPHREDDFPGFDESEIDSNDILSTNLAVSESLLQRIQTSTPNRTISRDSGIGLSTASDSQMTLTQSTLNECDEFMSIEISTGMGTDNVQEPTQSQESLSCLTQTDDMCNAQNAATADEALQINDDENVNTVARTETNSVLEVDSEQQLSNQLMSPDDENSDQNVANVATERDSSGIADELASERTLPDAKRSKLPGTESSVQESVNFEQNLYEKCSLVEKRVSEVNLMMERIQKWHRYLRPILAVSMERHHFDIFAIGTDIIETFPKKEEVEQSAPHTTLEKVMEGRDSSFLSRYFLSMLQLANANNVEIEVKNRDIEAPSSLSDIHLKLLSRKRHSIAIEDDIGAKVFPSRKRQHSITDESNSESEYEARTPVKNVNNFLDKQSMPNVLNKAHSVGNIQLPQLVNGKSDTRQVSDELLSISLLRSTSAGNENMTSNRTSTPCIASQRQVATKVTNKNRPRAKLMRQTERTVCTSPNAKNETIRDPCQLEQNQDWLSNNSRVNISVTPSVSNNTVISIYHNKYIKPSNNISYNVRTPRKSQETLKKNEISIPAEEQELLAVELPPFESIRRYDKTMVPSWLSNCYEANNVPPFNNAFIQATPGSAGFNYPTLLRTQDTACPIKRSQSGNDDLDSGFFSELSTTENASFMNV